MSTKTMQTRNISTKIFNEAENRAISDGLSSVQDAVRIFLTNYANGKIQLNLTSEISEKQSEKYYKDRLELQKMIASAKAKAYTSAEDLIKGTKDE